MQLLFANSIDLILSLFSAYSIVFISVTLQIDRSSHFKWQLELGKMHSHIYKISDEIRCDKMKNNKR